MSFETVLFYTNHYLINIYYHHYFLYLHKYINNKFLLGCYVRFNWHSAEDHKEEDQQRTQASPSDVNTKESEGAITTTKILPPQSQLMDWQSF